MEQAASFTTRILGEDFRVSVDSNGIFTVEMEGYEPFQATDLRTVRSLVEASILAAKVEVPFVTDKGDRGIIRGLHAGTHQPLVTWQDGRKGTLDRFAKIYEADDIPPAQVEELKRVLQSMRHLADRVKEILPGITANPTAMVARAMGIDLPVGQYGTPEREFVDAVVGKAGD